MGKRSFWQSLRRNRWLASTGMLAAGALAVYGVWQIPSMNQYHMETLDTPIVEDEKKEQTADSENDQAQNVLELPRDGETKESEGKSKETGEGGQETSDISGGDPDGKSTVQEMAENPQDGNAEQTGKKNAGKANAEAESKTTEKQDSVEVLSNPQSVLDSGNFDESAGLSWPMEGDVILNYDTEGVVYFQTLAQYRANPAIMIGGKPGNKVKASADGVVEKITKNEETGVTVTMSVGNSYEIVYGQLQDLKICEGDAVKEGAVIGTLAEPTDYFALEGPNLYFQILQDNTPVNPLLLLK